MEMSAKNLSALLQKKMPKNSNFLDKVKIAYRPYICPFSDLLEILPERSSIFDIGCGNGMFLSLVAEFKKPLSLGGTEITEQLINNTRNILQNYSLPISLGVFDGMNIPPEIKNYQYIFLIDIIHHVPRKNQIKFLENILNKMSPESILVIKDIDADNFFLSKFNKLHDFIFTGKAGEELGFSEIKKILADLGFSIVSSGKKRIFLYPHYTIICQKN